MSKNFKLALLVLLVFTMTTIGNSIIAQQQMDPEVAARELQEKIRVFNLEFCPPQEPINEINSETLSRLLEAQLIKKSEIETNFDQLVMVGGQVYPKDKVPIPEPATEPNPEPATLLRPRPQVPVGKNLTGSLNAACEDLENEKTRGETEGNKKPETFLPLKRRRVTYRDQQNQIKQMEIFSPPRFPAKKKNLSGKTGKKIRDFATTIIVPKDVDAQSVDKSAFESMPSADNWLDDDNGQTQK